MNRIEVKNLGFSYPNGWKVLEDASMHLEDKEKLAIWGANGCGKTTFFRLLTGLIKKQSGKIIFDGMEVEKEPDYRKLRMKCGLVLQNPEDQLFFPEVIDDVCFGPLNQGLSPKEALDVAYSTLESLDIKHLDHALSYELSGGQKRLVALATVLSMKPDVLLLDEPTNALDAESRVHLMNVIKNLDVSMIIVSHDPGLLSSTCNRFITIKDAKFNQLPAPQAYIHSHIRFAGVDSEASHHHSVVL